MYKHPTDKKPEIVDVDNLEAKLAECRAELKSCHARNFTAGMERAAEIVLEHYPASQSIVGKELYQAICGEINDTERRLLCINTLRIKNQKSST